MTNVRFPAFASLLLVFAGFLSLVACGGRDKPAEKAAEQAMEGALKQATGKDVDIDIDQNGKSVRIEGEGVRADLAETSEWPVDMFPEVPKFPFGQVTRVHKSQEEGNLKFNIFLKDVEPGGPKQYANQLKSAGWEVQIVDMGPKGGMVSGQNGNLGMNLAYSGERKDGMLAVFRTASE